MSILLTGPYKIRLFCLARHRKEEEATTMKVTLLMLIVIAVVIKCLMADHAMEVKSGHNSGLIRPRGWG